MGQEVEGEHLGDDYKGYVFKITGGNDKQGFTMKQGVITNLRVRLLLKKGMKNYRPRRTGERKRKSVRGCICGPDLSVIALTIVKKGDNELPGLTDAHVPRSKGPKRANKIRKMFNLEKEDNVAQYVTPLKYDDKDGETIYKTPKIQRLVTDRRIRRKKALQKIKKDRYSANVESRTNYEKLLSNFLKEKKEALKA
jgi:small subunit ribosomal protein S6e